MQQSAVQEFRAKHVLKEAIKAAHLGNSNSARFIRAIGCAAVEYGLESRGGCSGFNLISCALHQCGICNCQDEEEQHCGHKQTSSNY